MGDDRPRGALSGVGMATRLLSNMVLAPLFFLETMLEVYARRRAIVAQFQLTGSRGRQIRQSGDLGQPLIVVDEYLDAATRPSGDAGRDGKQQKE